MAKQPIPDDQDERERKFRVWQEQRIKDGIDPLIQEQLDRDAARMAAGLEPEGIMMMPDELRRRAGL